MGQWGDTYTIKGFVFTVHYDTEVWSPATIKSVIDYIQPASNSREVDNILNKFIGMTKYELEEALKAQDTKMETGELKADYHLYKRQLDELRNKHRWRKIEEGYPKAMCPVDVAKRRGEYWTHSIIHLIVSDEEYMADLMESMNWTHWRYRDNPE